MWNTKEIEQRFFDPDALPCYLDFEGPKPIMQIKCGCCAGTGKYNPLLGPPEPCKTCKGEGVVVKDVVPNYQQIKKDEFFQQGGYIALQGYNNLGKNVHPDLQKAKDAKTLSDQIFFAIATLPIGFQPNWIKYGQQISSFIGNFHKDIANAQRTCDNVPAIRLGEIQRSVARSDDPDL